VDEINAFCERKGRALIGNAPTQGTDRRKSSKSEEDQDDPVTAGRRLFGLFPMATNNRRDNDTAIP
jgi:hypothetical protein